MRREVEVSVFFLCFVVPRRMEEQKGAEERRKGGEVREMVSCLLGWACGGNMGGRDGGRGRGGCGRGRCSLTGLASIVSSRRRYDAGAQFFRGVCKCRSRGDP